MPILENARHERFVQNLIKGITQRIAYRDAFPDNNSNDKTIDEAASRLFNDSKVHARYEELLQQLENESIMSAKERMIWLTNVINGKEKDTTYLSVNGETTPIEKTADLNIKIKALDTLNKMDNTYQQNIKVSGNINNPFDGMSTEELRDILGNLENDK